MLAWGTNNKISVHTFAGYLYHIWLLANYLNYLPIFQLYLLTGRALQIALRHIITFAFPNKPDLFSKHLLSAHYVPGTILSVGSKAVKNRQKIPILMALTTQVKEKKYNIPNIAELSV